MDLFQKASRRTRYLVLCLFGLVQMVLMLRPLWLEWKENQSRDYGILSEGWMKEVIDRMLFEQFLVQSLTVITSILFILLFAAIHEWQRERGYHLSACHLLGGAMWCWFASIAFLLGPWSATPGNNYVRLNNLYADSYDKTGGPPSETAFEWVSPFSSWGEYTDSFGVGFAGYDATGFLLVLWWFALLAPPRREWFQRPFFDLRPSEWPVWQKRYFIAWSSLLLVYPFLAALDAISHPSPWIERGVFIQLSNQIHETSLLTHFGIVLNGMVVLALSAALVLRLNIRGSVLSRNALSGGCR
jgi:hypothetical protein